MHVHTVNSNLSIYWKQLSIQNLRGDFFFNFPLAVSNLRLTSFISVPHFDGFIVTFPGVEAKALWCPNFKQ
jgi:hypothetical protein